MINSQVLILLGLEMAVLGNSPKVYLKLGLGLN